VFEKYTNYEQNKTKPNLTYMTNVTRHRPASTTGSNHMHLTLWNAVNCGRY